MLEIKVTYFPTTESESGPMCISERLTTQRLANSATGLPGDTAKKLTRVLYENNPEFKKEFDDAQATRVSRMSVELSRSRVSNQLNEKINASDAVLFPFYVTYGSGSNLAKRYSMVLARSLEEARDAVFMVCGCKFCYLYTADEFSGQAEKYGLTLVALQPQRQL